MTLHGRYPIEHHLVGTWYLVSDTYMFGLMALELFFVNEQAFNTQPAPCPQALSNVHMLTCISNAFFDIILFRNLQAADPDADIVWPQATVSAILMSIQCMP